MLKASADFADAFARLWNAGSSRMVRSGMLVSVLLGGIILIELQRRGILIAEDVTPPTHLAAIAWAVSLLLVFEVVEMLLSLGQSVATSVGRHLQVYALVLLRDAFAELSKFPEPIRVTLDDQHALAVMGSDAAGAILLFLTATIFARLQTHMPIVPPGAAADTFVRLKKLLVVTLIGVFGSLILRDVGSALFGSNTFRLFDSFFTILVFVDVLLALISLAFSDAPTVIFRNFGFAFAAILLRLAIASPEFVRPALGLAGGLTAIAVTLAYNAAQRPPRDDAMFDDENGAPGDANAGAVGAA